MEIRQLQYFVSVAEELHFGRAAQRQHIAQSTLSQQLRRLERELGHDLFVRTSRSVELSPAGHRILPRARAVLVALDSLAAEARSLTGPAEETLRLGTGSSLGSRLDLFLDSLMAHDPDLRVQFRNLAGPQRIRQVRTGELDGAVVRGAVSIPGLRVLPLFSDRLVAVLPAAHPLAGRQAVPLDALRDLPLRIVPRDLNPALVDLLLSACATAGFRPVLGRPFTTQHDTLAEIALSADSWTVLYASNAEAGLSRRVVWREFAGTPLAVPVSLALRPGLPARRVERLAVACADVRDQLAEPAPGAAID
ncbi:LysR substrate-binding domain-containing protein [Kitasatospora sp. NPDC085879]|uniref:LysR substrate-binding domain-containing protein n=1 Tax=Kitasatospora sp. NPDC085879 TaxID=3154769 RepID=UPI00342528ED